MNKKLIIITLLALVAILTVLPLGARAQTKADSLRADSVYKSMELSPTTSRTIPTRSQIR